MKIRIFTSVICLFVCWQNANLAQIRANAYSGYCIGLVDFDGFLESALTMLP